MAVSASKGDETLLTFVGESHRLFIEGRGFDFEKLVVGSEGKAKLFLNNSEHNLYTFLRINITCKQQFFAKQHSERQYVLVQIFILRRLALFSAAESEH